ncbi:hypothetical protein [Fluviispira multicolorata]|uniref:Uncharacterized protein n=1 Tax=Fluviispira multicolorata TaxID=2654512 RepID=A0A833JDC4_9BACT|nr:hypothetical protein [Fluviispira multicolorata]KAB8030855.1 hypothetical protein GCL57_07730 [Fluviispira multicolorata]
MEKNLLLKNKIIKKSKDETFIIIFVSIILSLGSFTFYLYEKYIIIPDKIINLTIPSLLHSFQRGDDFSLKNKLSNLESSDIFSAIWFENQNNYSIKFEPKFLPEILVQNII